MAMDRNDSPVLSQVREGMTAVDARGDTVGTVVFVQLADPGAAEPGDTGMDRDDGLLALLEIDTDEDVTERMLQRGYIRIDAKGLFAGDRFVLADDVAGVEGDIVRLRVDKDHIEHPG
jgi:hypothetical protein